MVPRLTEKLDYRIQRISYIPYIELALGNDKQKVPVTINIADPPQLGSW